MRQSCWAPNTVSLECAPEIMVAWVKTCGGGQKTCGGGQKCSLLQYFVYSSLLLANKIDAWTYQVTCALGGYPCLPMCFWMQSLCIVQIINMNQALSFRDVIREIKRESLLKTLTILKAHLYSRTRNCEK